jgi:hypothetical protein
VLDNHSVELGTQDKEIVLIRMKRAFTTVPREFDINPKFPHGENLMLLQHSAIGVPMSGTFLSVIRCVICSLQAP